MVSLPAPELTVSLPVPRVMMSAASSVVIVLLPALPLQSVHHAYQYHCNCMCTCQYHYQRDNVCASTTECNRLRASCVGSLGDIQSNRTSSLTASGVCHGLTGRNHFRSRGNSDVSVKRYVTTSKSVTVSRSFATRSVPSAVRIRVSKFPRHQSGIGGLRIDC